LKIGWLFIMARPLRIEYPGALYHITSRGNNKQNIFIDDSDRISFLEILSKVIEEREWLCYAFCLMGNHYHLLIETPKANLSRGMQQLDSVYARRFNKRHERVGHLFQARFHAALIEKEVYLLEVLRYTVLNPVRAGLCKDPAFYKWSSYLDVLGKRKPLHFLNIAFVISLFSNPGKDPVDEYREFILSGFKSDIGNKLYESDVLGSKEFVEKTKGLKKTAVTINRPSISEILENIGFDKKMRNEKIVEAYLKYDYQVNEIAEHLGLHRTTIRRILHRFGV